MTGRHSARNNIYIFLDFKCNSHRALMKCLGQAKICTNKTSEQIRISNLTKWFNINESVTEITNAGCRLLNDGKLQLR
jgi:hypothetical protein